MSTETETPVAAPAAPLVWSADLDGVQMSDGSTEPLFRFQVFVNGYRIERAWFASVPAQQAQEIVVSATGRVVEEKNGNPRLRSLRGKVEIRRRRPRA